MSLRNAFIFAVGLVALGTGAAQAQDDRYRKTNDGYGDDRRGDDRLYKDDGDYDEGGYYGDERYGDERYGDERYRSGNSRGQGRAMGARLRQMDSNGDGRITRSEWRGNEQAFSRRDRNGDGVLAGNELRRRNRNANRNRNRDNDDTRFDF